VNIVLDAFMMFVILGVGILIGIALENLDAGGGF